MIFLVILFYVSCFIRDVICFFVFNNKLNTKNNIKNFFYLFLEGGYALAFMHGVVNGMLTKIHVLSIILWVSELIILNRLSLKFFLKLLDINDASIAEKIRAL